MLRNLSIASLLLASSSLALAQGADPAAPAPTAAPTDPAAAPTAVPAAATIDAAAPTGVAVAAPAPAPAPAPATSGLRNGFSLSAGQEFGGDRDISGTMFGFDWRIGYRISEPLSVYLHSHMSFGSASEGNGAKGVTGTFAAAVLGEYMLPIRLFVAGGGGWGVLNNPNGPLAQARVGYYPMKTSAIGKARRLNVAVDARFYFANQGYGMVNQIQLSLGYDRF